MENAQQVSYFENIDTLLDGYPFESPETESSFVDSVLSEILNAIRENKTVLTHHVMGRVVERVVKMMSEAQLQQVFLALQGALPQPRASPLSVSWRSRMRCV